MTTKEDNQQPATSPAGRHWHLPSDEANDLIAVATVYVTSLVHTLSTGDYFGSAAPITALTAILVAQWRKSQKTRRADPARRRRRRGPGRHRRTEVVLRFSVPQFGRGRRDGVRLAERIAAYRTIRPVGNKASIKSPGHNLTQNDHSR
ncbi:MAG: hypothetical protein FWE35_02175 [Streptosporangiales bacterium]|nr:hypothetical protein [Streptosporangiales bacterium]